MNHLIAKLKILLRAEKALYKADASRRANAMVLSAVAAGCVIVALVFANMGLFFWLTEASDHCRAAFVLAAINLALTAVPIILARRLGPSGEEAMLQELRDLTLDEVTRELEQVSTDIGSISAEIKAMISGDKSVGDQLHTTLSPAIAFALDLLQNTPTDQVTDHGHGEAKQSGADL